MRKRKKKRRTRRKRRRQEGGEMEMNLGEQHEQWGLGELDMDNEC